MFTMYYGVALVLSLLLIIFMARSSYLTIDTHLWTIIILTVIIILGYWLQSRAETPEGVMLSLCYIYIDSTIYLLVVLFAMLKSLNIKVKARYKSLGFLLAFGHLGLVWACFNNNLYFSGVSFEENSYGRYLVLSSGPLKWIHYVYLVGIIIFVIGIMIYCIVRKDSYSKKSLHIYVFFLISGLILYLVELLLGSKHSFLPFLYLIGEFIIIINYDFLHSHNLSYLIFSQTKAEGAPGYIAFDLKGQLLNYNEKALEMFPILKNEKLDYRLSDGGIQSIIYEYMDEFSKNDCKSKKVTLEDKIYELDLNLFKVKENGDYKGFILNIWDVTEQERNILLIKEQNESLIQSTEVIDALSKMYYILYEMDFINDTFREIHAPEYISNFLKKSDSARENLHTIANDMYVKEDIEKAADFFKTEEWEARLEGRNSVSIECRGNYVGWTRINILVSSRTKEGKLSKILIAIENINDEKKREYQYHNIIECLSKQYPKVWSINVKDRSMGLIRNDDLALTLDETIATKNDYNTAMKTYIEEFVDSKDQEHLWFCTDFESLIKNIPDNGVYSINYLAKSKDGSDKYYSMVFAKAAEGNIILAFKDIDEMYRKEQAKEVELKEALKLAEDANKIMSSYNEKLSEDVRIKTASIVEMQRNVVLGMANMIEGRDNNTGGHVKRTSDVIKILVQKYSELYEGRLSPDDMEDIILAAPMHDLGKIVIDNSILFKPEKLSDEEYEIMKMHPVKSGEIVHSILDGVVEEHMVKISYNLARYHHEKWNGQGYPEGLKGEEIPLEARIMAVADVYDALVSERVYKKPFGFARAAEIMYENMGTHFDPDMKAVFKASRKALEQYYSFN